MNIAKIIIFINRPGNTATKFDTLEKPLHTVKLIDTKDGSHTFFSDLFHTTFHSTDGSMEESKHVFINNGLNYLLGNSIQNDISILEIGFGTGLNALLTLVESVNHKRCIHYHALEFYPLVYEHIKHLNYLQHIPMQYHSGFEKMHLQEWNTTAEIKQDFYFTKMLNRIETYQNDQQFDLIYFDAFSPKEQPELWTESVFCNMYAALKPGGVLVTYCAQGQMKRYMKSAGFKVSALPGFGSKREMTMAEKPHN